VADPGTFKYNVIEGIDMHAYATDPKHNQKVLSIKQNLPQITGAAVIQDYISKVAPKSQVTGQMIWDSAQKTGVPVDLMVALAQEESLFGTKGMARKTMNVGNVMNTGANTRTFNDWQSGVQSMANFLAQHQTGRVAPSPVTDKSLYQDLAVNY
jgi:flagellum-specific peptidoglycan hydrolase FlgJ